MLKCIVSFQYNQTPLHYASKRGHIEVVIAIISQGATVDVNGNVRHCVSYMNKSYRINSTC